MFLAVIPCQLLVAEDLNVGNDKKPNIVYIMSDDHASHAIGAYGSKSIKTPNLDRLAKEGTDFTRFTVANGVCSPSRAAVMTGQFPA